MLLNIAARSDGDHFVVTAQNGAEPDANILVQPYMSDHISIGRDPVALGLRQFGQIRKAYIGISRPVGRVRSALDRAGQATRYAVPSTRILASDVQPGRRVQGGHETVEYSSAGETASNRKIESDPCFRRCRMPSRAGSGSPKMNGRRTQGKTDLTSLRTHDGASCSKCFENSKQYRSSLSRYRPE